MNAIRASRVVLSCLVALSAGASAGEKPGPPGNDPLSAHGRDKLGSGYALGISGPVFQSMHIAGGVFTLNQGDANHWPPIDLTGAGVRQTYPFQIALAEPMFHPLPASEVSTSYAFPWEETAGLRSFDTGAVNSDILPFIRTPHPAGFYDGLSGVAGSHGYIPEPAFSLF